MKKLMFVAAAALCGSLLADVTSANIVGYNTITFPAGQQYTLIAIPFDSIGSTEGYTIDELFAGKSMEIFTSAPAAGNADQVQVWDGTKYNSLYLNKNTLTTGINPQKNGHWCLTGSKPDDSWADAAGGPCKKKFPAGTSFWIKRKIPTGQTAADLPALTATVAGQVVVKADGKAGYVINGAPSDSTFGYTLIAAGFSAGFAPNPDIASGDESKKVNWEEMGCWPAAAAGNADQLQFWDGAKYNSLYLNKNTLTTGINPQKNGHWCLTGSKPDDTWADAAGGPCKKTFEPTVGFWYKRFKGKGSFTFYVNQPYSL